MLGLTTDDYHHFRKSRDHLSFIANSPGIYEADLRLEAGDLAADLADFLAEWR